MAVLCCDGEASEATHGGGSGGRGPLQHNFPDAQKSFRSISRREPRLCTLVVVAQAQRSPQNAKRCAQNAMGVPAFFKWLSVKYPKIVVDCLEERPTWTDDGARVDVDTSTPNPNGLEFDNLFLDMNGIIHPASRTEDRPPPETEDDMCLAIFDYLERVFAAARASCCTWRSAASRARR